MGPTAGMEFLPSRDSNRGPSIPYKYIPRPHTTPAAPPSDTSRWQIPKSGQAHGACRIVLYQRRPESTAQWNSSIQMHVAAVMLIYLETEWVSTAVLLEVEHV